MQNSGICLRHVACRDSLPTEMKEVSSSNFGLVIAYLIPGFTALWGISSFSETVRVWLDTSNAAAPTVGGFLYATLASLGVGMIVNAFRWLTVDHLHHATGIRYPECDFSQLQHGLGAYRLLVDFYYRYHEFFGNMLVAGTFSYIVLRTHSGVVGPLPSDIWYFGTAILLWMGSRDTLRKYYNRTEALLRRIESTQTNAQEPIVTPSAASIPEDRLPRLLPAEKC